MARIEGVITIDFKTDKSITEKEFRQFKTNLNKMIEDHWEMMVFEAANEAGFEADSFEPILLDELICDFED
jgi:hypothetical protein